MFDAGSKFLKCRGMARIYHGPRKGKAYLEEAEPTNRETGDSYCDNTDTSIFSKPCPPSPTVSARQSFFAIDSQVQIDFTYPRNNSHRS